MRNDALVGMAAFLPPQGTASWVNVALVCNSLLFFFFLTFGVGVASGAYYCFGV